MGSVIEVTDPTFHAIRLSHSTAVGDAILVTANQCKSLRTPKEVDRLLRDWLHIYVIALSHAARHEAL